MLLLYLTYEELKHIQYSPLLPPVGFLLYLTYEELKLLLQFWYQRFPQKLFVVPYL